MLKAARGEMPDVLPYAPRLGNWWLSNVARDSLPPECRGLSLPEILDDLGVAHHFIDHTLPAENPGHHLFTDNYAIARGLGLGGLTGSCYRLELTEVDTRITRDGERVTVEYHTPVGMARYSMRVGESLRRRGATIAYPGEKLLKEPGDYAVASHIFRNIKVTPEHWRFRRFEEAMGDSGLAFASGHGAASPMHHILRDLMDTNQFYLELHDHPDGFRQLVEDMTPYFDAVMRVVTDLPAEAVYYGTNYDEVITPPPFFEKHLLPWLQKYTGWLHESGKVVACHCDGENQRLLDLYVRSGMDVADAMNCAPMVKSTIPEIREAFQGRITVFGGLASLIFLESFSESAFEAHLEQLFRDIEPGDRMILAISDTLPPDAGLDRVRRIQRMVEEQGRLPLA
jgi:hypothetical protein